MTKKDQWLREKEARLQNNFDRRFVVEALSDDDVPSEQEVRKAVRDGQGGLDKIIEKYLPSNAADGSGVDFKLGEHAIFLPAADRNLQQIFFHERPGLNATRVILMQIFKTVEHLHENNLMHGDVKMQNFVRFQHDNNRLRVIDFDASAEFVPFGSETQFCAAGTKFSSATLPPEMFCELSEKDRKKLQVNWQGEGKNVRNKVAPVSFKMGSITKWYAVKSSLRSSSRQGCQQFVRRDDLPYELVPASPT